MNSFIQVASDLACQAGARLTELRKLTLVKERKSDGSLVTNADKEADEIIRSGLQKAFPEHAVLTEESGMHGNPDSEYVWVVDPLDGTRAYVKGISGFSVMIGLLNRGKPFAGVVYDPWEGHLYDALQGEGSFHSVEGQERRRVRVSSRREWPEMPIVTSTGFPAALDRPIREELSGPWIPAVNSVGIKVGFVVRQIADIYINHHSVHYWDTCAPQIILEEAGGVITFLDGQPLHYDLHSVHRHQAPTLATNGVRHAELLEKLGPLVRPSE